MIQTVPEQDSFLEQITDALCRRGWRLPAIIALESGHPVTFISSQLLWIGQPLLSMFVSSNLIRQTAAMLEEPEAVAALIARLEERET